MTSFIIGLTSAAFGLFIVMTILEARVPFLRAREQAYRLHELRDRLQMLDIQKKISTTSMTYSFLMPSINLAIKNAGVLSLSKVLALASAINRNAKDESYPSIVEDVKAHDAEVQKLFYEFMGVLAWMLISNDKLVHVMYGATKYIAIEINKHVLKTVTSSVKLLLPNQTRAVSEARKFQKLSRGTYAVQPSISSMVHT